MAQRTFTQRSAAFRLVDRIEKLGHKIQKLGIQAEEHWDRIALRGASPPDADFDADTAREEVLDKRDELNVLLGSDEKCQRLRHDFEANKKAIETQLDPLEDPEVKAVVQTKRLTCQEYLLATRHDASELEKLQFPKETLSTNEAELDRLRAQARTYQTRIAQLEDNAALRTENERLRAQLTRLLLEKQTGLEIPEHDALNTPPNLLELEQAHQDKIEIDRKLKLLLDHMAALADDNLQGKSIDHERLIEFVLLETPRPQAVLSSSANSPDVSWSLSFSSPDKIASLGHQSFSQLAVRLRVMLPVASDRYRILLLLEAMIQKVASCTGTELIDVYRLFQCRLDNYGRPANPEVEALIDCRIFELIIRGAESLNRTVRHISDLFDQWIRLISPQQAWTRSLLFYAYRTWINEHGKAIARMSPFITLPEVWMLATKDSETNRRVSEYSYRLARYHDESSGESPRRLFAGQIAFFDKVYALVDMNMESGEILIFNRQDVTYDMETGTLRFPSRFNAHGHSQQRPFIFSFDDECFVKDHMQDVCHTGITKSRGFHA